MGERLMTLAEVARYLGVSRHTLYDWRVRHLGPPGYRVGRHVRYRLSEVDAWLEERRDEREGI
jgi:excisionase family DNA binding protein